MLQMRFVASWMIKPFFFLHLKMTILRSLHQHDDRPTWKISSSIRWPSLLGMVSLWEVMSSSSHSPMVVISFLEVSVICSAGLVRIIFMSLAENRRELCYPSNNVSKRVSTLEICKKALVKEMCAFYKCLSCLYCCKLMGEGHGFSLCVWR